MCSSAKPWKERQDWDFRFQFPISSNFHMHPAWKLPMFPCKPCKPCKPWNWTLPTTRHYPAQESRLHWSCEEVRGRYSQAWYSWSASISLIWLVGPAFLRDELAAVEASNKWRSAFHDDLWNAHDDSARFTRCALHFFWCIESCRKQLPLTFKLLQCAEASWTAWSSNKHRACQFLQNFKILHDSSTCNSLKLVVTRCNYCKVLAEIKAVLTILPHALLRYRPGQILGPCRGAVGFG